MINDSNTQPLAVATQVLQDAGVLFLTVYLFQGLKQSAGSFGNDVQSGLLGAEG